MFFIQVFFLMAVVNCQREATIDRILGRNGENKSKIDSISTENEINKTLIDKIIDDRESKLI